VFPARSIRGSIRLATALAVAATLTLSACGGDDAPSDGAQESADTGAEPGEGSVTAPGSEESQPSVAVPEDLCVLISAEDVGAVLGEPVRAEPAAYGCSYLGDVRESVYPLITAQEDVEGAGGIAAAQTGAELTVSGTGESLTVDGNPGYVVHGSFGAGTVSQGGVAVNGLIVTVTLSGGEPVANNATVIALLELAAAAV